MNEFSTVLSAVVPVFGIAAVGLMIRKLNWLTEEADQSLLRVNVNLLLPCLILDAAIGNPALSKLSNLLLAPLVGFGTVALGVVLALASRRLHGLTERRAQRTFAVSVGMYNYGYVPLPLALLLFDKETAGVLFVHNVGVELGLWTLGVMLLTGGSLGRDWRRIVNAPLIAIVLAVMLNALGWHTHVPQVVLTAVHWLGQCAIPMALILIGAIVADHLHEFHSASGWRVIGTAVWLRIGVLPVLFLLLAKYLPGSLELKRVMVLEAAMPAAVFPIIMARHYHGDPPTALRVVIGTSAVGLVTIPLWIKFGMHFVGIE
ncbi:MAG: AEC family transporter [Verrucomicrobia bacterium]|nr:AEC family transporter [Verrucomicrobiota bacterium]